MRICAGTARASLWTWISQATRSEGWPSANLTRFRARWLLRPPPSSPPIVLDTWGVAFPEQLADYVASGIDMMDCVLPTRNARNGCLFTSAGRINIKNAIYADDLRPLTSAVPAWFAARTRRLLAHLFTQ